MNTKRNTKSGWVMALNTINLPAIMRRLNMAMLYFDLEKQVVE